MKLKKSIWDEPTIANGNESRCCTDIKAENCGVTKETKRYH